MHQKKPDSPAPEARPASQPADHFADIAATVARAAVKLLGRARGWAGPIERVGFAADLVGRTEYWASREMFGSKMFHPQVVENLLRKYEIALWRAKDGTCRLAYIAGPQPYEEPALFAIGRTLPGQCRNCGVVEEDLSELEPALAGIAGGGNVHPMCADAWADRVRHSARTTTTRASANAAA